MGLPAGLRFVLASGLASDNVELSSLHKYNLIKRPTSPLGTIEYDIHNSRNWAAGLDSPPILILQDGLFEGPLGLEHPVLELPHGFPGGEDHLHHQYVVHLKLALLEFLSGRLPQNFFPGLAFFVVPVELAGEFPDLAVQAQDFDVRQGLAGYQQVLDGAGQDVL